MVKVKEIIEGTAKNYIDVHKLSEGKGALFNYMKHVRRNMPPEGYKDIKRMGQLKTTDVAPRLTPVPRRPIKGFKAYIPARHLPY